MKIYLDACCLNRPFDDQNQDRIRLESEAILVILNRLYNRKWEWIGSEVLDIEIRNTPNGERLQYLKQLALNIHQSIEINNNVVTRAKELAIIGFKSFDAMHISCSEIAYVDIFLTTDDKLIKLSERNKDKLKVSIANPLLWLMEKM